MTAELSDRPHYVYELLDAAGGHVYVGCTSNLSQRLANHSASKDWFTDVTRVEADLYPDQRSALDAERERIELCVGLSSTVPSSSRSLRAWTPDRARAAAELLYRIEPAADRGAAGPSPTAATPQTVVGDTQTERTQR